MPRSLRGTADLVEEPVLDADPVARVTVAGVPRPEQVAAGGSDPDEVPLDEIEVRPDTRDPHTVAGVRGDHVVQDVVARCVLDVGGLQETARGLDPDALGPVAVRRIEPVVQRADQADLVADDLVARGPRRRSRSPAARCR